MNLKEFKNIIKDLPDNMEIVFKGTEGDVLWIDTATIEEHNLSPFLNEKGDYPKEKCLVLED